jgi:hypothetical protein
MNFRDASSPPAAVLEGSASEEVTVTSFSATV